MNKKKVAIISIIVLIIVVLAESILAYTISSIKNPEGIIFSIKENFLEKNKSNLNLEMRSLGSAAKSDLFEDDYVGGEIQGINLIQNADFSSTWSHWTDATWNVESEVKISDGKGRIVISDNTGGGDSKLFHDEAVVNPGTYRFGAEVSNTVEAKVKLYLKKKDGKDEWRWIGDVPLSKEERVISFESTFDNDIETAVVVIVIDEPGSLTVDNYFLLKK